MQSALEITLLFLAASVFGVVLFRKLKLPPMLGYLMVGAVIGPYGLALAENSTATQGFAAFGVVFLMFSIGLEFSLPKLRSMRKTVFGLGMAQVLVTILSTLLAAWVSALLLPEFWQISWQAAFALGAAFSMSSTAIVSKLLVERLEIESSHGRQIFGILLFQDLALVPLLIIVPALAAHDDHLLKTLGFAIAKASLVLVVLLFLGKKIMRNWFRVVVMLRSQELFMLNLLLITLGAAWITERAGLSLALGAFVAGMLISETEFRHQVEEDIKSFRDVLLGLFFVTIGMLLNIGLVVTHWWAVLLLLLIPIAFKCGLVVLLAKWFGNSTGVALRTGLALAQAGEFGFVLLNQMSALNLMNPLLTQLVLAAMVLSMLAAPFLLEHSDAIVMKLSSTEWMQQSLNITQIATRSMGQEKHVVIAGFGRTGQSLAVLLDEEKIPYHALDLDPDRVRAAQAAGSVVSYGDATRRESLVAAGVARASVLVITYASTASALKILHHVKELNPVLPVVVRSNDDSDLEKLREAGAAEVVPEVIEGGLMLASHALVLLGVPVRRVVHRVQRARDDRYESLRGYFHGASDAASDSDNLQVRLQSIPITDGANAQDKSIAELNLHDLNVELINLRRAMQRFEFTPQTRLAAGDVLVLRGTTEELALAEERLLG
ncbi:CPA2 family monovalent cation:H+ antiporter-2 [Oxalobacteraceae bacterium GrIS 2.11]